MELIIFLQENLVSVLRVLIDAYLLIYARHKANEQQLIVARTLKQEDFILATKNIGESDSALLKTKGNGIHIVSSKPCTIDYLRISILMSSSGLSKEFTPFAYIDIRGRGAYNSLVLTVPFIIENNKHSGNNMNVSNTADKMGLVLLDYRDEPTENDEFELNLATAIALRSHKDWAGFYINIPIRPQLRTIGQPWVETESLPNWKSNPGEPDTIYFPAIDTLEVSIKELPEQYEFSTLELLPAPEFRSESECRWISKTQQGFRAHSSIACRLDEKGARAQAEVRRINGGFAVGLWTAVFVTVAIDLAWTGVSLIGEFITQLSTAE